MQLFKVIRGYFKGTEGILLFVFVCFLTLAVNHLEKQDGFSTVPYTGLRFCDCGNEFSQDLKKQEDILFWRAYDFTRE